MSKHKSPSNVHSHERPPLQDVHFSIVASSSLPHPAHSKSRELSHSVVPMLQQESPTERPRKEPSARSVLIRFSHSLCQNQVSRSFRSKRYPRFSKIVRAACRYSKSTSVNASSSQFTRDVKDKCNILQKKVNKSLPRTKDISIRTTHRK
jgi:hypothetical protein